MQLQKRGFRPSQLQHLLSLLTGEGTAVAVLGAGGERLDTDIAVWLPKLLASLPEMPDAPVATTPGGSTVKTVGYDGPTIDVK